MSRRTLAALTFLVLGTGLAVAASPADDATSAPASTTTAAAERAHAFPPPEANPRAGRGEAERRTDSPPAAVRGGSATAIADRSEQTQTIAAQTAARGLSGLIAGPRPGSGDPQMPAWADFRETANPIPPSRVKLRYGPSTPSPRSRPAR